MIKETPVVTRDGRKWQNRRLYDLNYVSDNCINGMGRIPRMHGKQRQTERRDHLGCLRVNVRMG
jgi:hypothetical protein